VTTYLSTNCHYLSLYSILMCFCWGEHPLQEKLPWGNGEGCSHWLSEISIFLLWFSMGFV